MKIATALALAAAVAALSGAATARSSLYYHVAFYSDAGHTVQVGEYQQYCLNNNIIMTPQVTGETSPYAVYSPIGNCPGLGDW